MKVYSFNVHYSSSYLLNIPLKKKIKSSFWKNCKQTCWPLNTSMKPRLLLAFLQNMYSLLLSLRLNYRNWQGGEKRKRTEVQGKWKQETEAVLDAHIIATKLSIIFLSREMFSFHLSQQMHFFDNVGIQQKKHLKVIKAQLDTNSVLAFCTNSIPPGCIFKKEYAILPKIQRNWRVFYFYFFNVFYEVLT